MNKRIPSFLAGGLTVALLFSLGLSALAASGTLTGQVTFGGVNVFVGEKQGIFADETLKTSNGEEIPSTVTYTDAKGGGTVYLPVRKMTELFETDVSYQVGTSNIYFDEVISKYTAKLMATLVDGDYPKNSKGETYGSSALAEIVGHEPDLVAVIATNGKQGYARREELNGPELNTREEILEYMENRPESRTVAVYDLDGNKIGEFVIKNVEHPELIPEVADKLAELEADRPEE